jgi:TonB family protein
MNNPPLEKIKVAAPCKAEWAWMYGDDRVRFCGQCNQNVYNLSAMTREQAETLILRTEGRLCVRFYRRADGTILTGNCSVGLRAIRDKFRSTRTHIIAAILTLLAYIGILWRFDSPSGVMMGGVKEVFKPYPVMGDIAAPDPSDAAPLVEKNEQFIRDKAVFKVIPVFYSGSLKRAKDEVIVRVEISPPGEVISAALIEGDSALKEIAEEAARRWKFTPTLVGGRPARVESRLTFQIQQ